MAVKIVFSTSVPSGSLWIVLQGAFVQSWLSPPLMESCVTTHVIAKVV
jgi:hypothetical protein